MQDWRLPRKYFTEQGGISEATTRSLIRDNPELAADESGYPVFGIIRALNKKLQSQKIDINGEEVDLDRDSKYEKMMKDRINNQIKMGLLIPKEAAKQRMLNTLGAFARKVKYSIKHVAPKLVGIQSKKIIEEQLINNYNDAVNFLRQEAKDMRWEEDGSVEALRTQVTKMLPDDDKFNELYKDSMENDTW